MHAELRDQGVATSRKRVARLMRSEGLRARMRKRYRCTTMSDHDQPVAANLLDRRFEAEQPNQRWVGDVTEVLTGVRKGSTDGAGSSVINLSTESGEAPHMDEFADDPADDFADEFGSRKSVILRERARHPAPPPIGANSGAR